MPLSPDSKLARVREAMAKNDWDEAIRITGQFQNVGPEGEAIRRARDALNNPSLYKQLGHGLFEIRQQGIEALKKRYDVSWEAVKNNQSDSGEK